MFVMLLYNVQEIKLQYQSRLLECSVIETSISGLSIQTTYFSSALSWQVLAPMHRTYICQIGCILE